MGIIVSNSKNILNPCSLDFEERQEQIREEKNEEFENSQRNKNSPFKNWYQFNLEHNKDMIWLARNYPKAHLILLFLLEQMDGYNAVMCSYQVITEALNIGRTTASQSIRILKDKGFIVIMKSGTSNIYIVNNNLAWKSWGKNQKYCKFPANVIISANENNNYNNNIEKSKVNQIDVKS